MLRYRNFGLSVLMGLYVDFLVYFDFLDGFCVIFNIVNEIVSEYYFFF